MSVYQLNKILYLLDIDESFLQRVKGDPAETIKEFELSSDERKALLNGNIAALFEMGVHTFLLNATVRHEAFGVTREAYVRQMRAFDHD
jgi:Aromatic-ring-opening dioxygenase LigAB, LigA subunit